MKSGSPNERTESARVNTTRRLMRNVCTVLNKSGINRRSAKCGMLPRYSSRHKARVWTGCLLIAAGIAAVSLVLIYQPVKIVGNSMTPLLWDHEAIVINRLVYHFEPIHRDEVVVFHYPLDTTQFSSSALWACRERPFRSGKVSSTSMGIAFLSLTSHHNMRIRATLALFRCPVVAILY